MSAFDDTALLKRLEGVRDRTEPPTPLWRELCRERWEAKAAVQRLAVALMCIKRHCNNPDFCYKTANTALEGIPAALQPPSAPPHTEVTPEPPKGS